MWGWWGYEDGAVGVAVLWGWRCCGPHSGGCGPSKRCFGIRPALSAVRVGKSQLGFRIAALSRGGGGALSCEMDQQRTAPLRSALRRRFEPHEAAPLSGPSIICVSAEVRWGRSGPARSAACAVWAGMGRGEAERLLRPPGNVGSPPEPAVGRSAAPTGGSGGGSVFWGPFRSLLERRQFLPNCWLEKRNVCSGSQ